MIEPKVFVPYDRPTGVPRQVVAERKKRHFAAQDIAKLMEVNGVPGLMVRTCVTN